MYDIPELEKKWKKYKRNKIKKPILISLGTILIVVVAGGGFFYYKSKKNSSEAQKVVKKETKKSEESSSAIIIKKTPIVSQKKRETNSDEIDLSNATIIKPNVPDDDIRVIGFDNKGKKEIVNKYKDIIEQPKVDPIVQEYEERFKETQDPQDALFLAKYFYKKGDYAKAETWAINTNNIDGEIEESWLIFAKAKAKQGHRVEAIKVLQEYYDSTSSEKAKILLDKLRRNKAF